MSAKRFRIAFSFAGEKRDFVAKLAAILAQRFTKAAILYDKFHEAEFARYDLGVYLPGLYRDQSDLVVAVLCKGYDVKLWTGWEWMAIHAQLNKNEGARIMLCRFDHVHVDGLFENAGFVELDHKTPEQAATLILERLALNEGKTKDHYTTPASASPPVLKTATPNNLPRLQPFFGRAQELAAIHDALDPEARTWGALIDGPGGMGKTSLAVRAAYDCPPGQFQRIIFLSVKDRELDDDGVRKLSGFILPGFLEMLNELARELGQPDIVKAPEDQRIRLLLDALRPAQVLLILDNLESLTKDDRDQLFTFVKRLPQGCKAILTSRRRIGSSSELLILEKLDQAAALETLADLARRNPLLARTSEAERIALYTQTDGKPLLLRWVAGQLGRGSCRTFTDALHFLRSCPPDNDPLEFIFGDLAQEFTAEETRVLVALTYFTLPATVAHIAELASLDEAPVETALRTLANRSLIVPDQEERAYALVPMVADFLRRKRPEVVAETGSRLEQRAYALIVENGYDQHDRFPVLDAAWSTVAPALLLFVAGPNPRLQTVCDALHPFLDFTGRWDEWLSLNQQAEARAVAAGDHANAGWRAFQAGSVHEQRQRADAVLTCADRAAAHWQTAQAGARERATAIVLRGHGHKLKADYPAAIAAYREALELNRSLSTESADVAIDLNALANVESESGDLDAAEQDYREALRIARAVGHAEMMAGIPGNLAELALDRQDWPGAEILAREALSLCETVGRQQLITSNCRRLAQALVQQGKKAEAFPCARRAVEIYTQLGHPDLETARATLGKCES
jgi:tetratricopeptide (TPR) repeat protein